MRTGTSLWRGAFALLLLLAGSLKALAPGDERGATLYLLAGTPTEESPEARYPVTLYKVDAGKTLRLVREVVSSDQGLRLVRQGDRAIYVVFPTMVGSSMSVIHIDDPTRNDLREPNAKAFFVADSDVVVATRLEGDAQERLLLPLMTDTRNPRSPKGVLVEEPAAIETSRTEGPGDWNLYAFLRWPGTPVGPSLYSDLVGSAIGGNLSLAVFGHTTRIDSLPPELSGSAATTVPVILGASSQFTILTAQRAPTAGTTGHEIQKRTIYVHDRRQDHWFTLHLPGNGSATRLWGPWLTLEVQQWVSADVKSPGRDDEREAYTKTLPSVRSMYADLQSQVWTPGILVLHNLADGRELTLATGEEDSEVLWAGQESVLYRVNDKIYQANITGTTLGSPRLLVEGEDVPEIHWVFWSR